MQKGETMNVRKPVDYGTMYMELTAILAQNLPQMDEIYAIGKAISQRSEKGAAVAAAEFLQANFPDRAGFPRAMCAGCAIFIKFMKMTKRSSGWQ